MKIKNRLFFVVTSVVTAPITGALFKWEYIQHKMVPFTGLGKEVADPV
jgi:hypothetical protein